MATLHKLFKAAVDYKASDIHVAPGEPFMIRRLGKLQKLKASPLTAQQSSSIIFEVLNGEQQAKLEAEQQLDFALDVENLGRFRGSAMYHNNGISAAFRVIPPEIPSLDSLGMPDIVKKVLDNHQGLILVTGATGHGKSTTLAAMVDYINSTRSHHILTVEDPIEFIYPIKKSVVNQRELARDTGSYANALKGALRQDPDVIVIGELRDLETISLAISASETGHLVIGTLSTSSAAKTIDRIIDSYPPNEQSQIRATLSESFKAVITQRLIPAKDGKSMVMALEILIGTLPLTNLIKDAKTFQIPSIMQTGRSVGMMIMDDSIMALLNAGKITAAEACANALNPGRFQPLADRENANGDH
ncbi:type IV pilus twitching motility protein PilT [Desulfobotulus mexicanus]|uniref:Type IV pilus twitching motility protein PilT n=1 Tax=Desulfobotulus mexicanus TaxID=2586642 RepID=A0A5Q4VCZ7_9BACT|nr:type IV pilus twitching motility protein PilT [Desulfobotulus mexicanus]TYT75584.1 type IV pilus twitching motility protein PilT [Desulfobotulus mexicanus]